MFKKIKTLPEYLQPKIISAVAFIHQCSPDIEKAVKRINLLQKHLSEKEMCWVMSLLTYEKILDNVKEHPEFGKYQSQIKERTIN